MRRFALFLLTLGLAAVPVRATVPNGCEELVARVLEAVATRHYDATTRDRAASPVETPEESCAAAPGTREAVERALAPLDDPAIRLLDTDHFDRMIAEWSGRPVVGVGLSEVLSIDIDEGSGRLTVIAPVPGSPAAAAGLRAGDVVTRIDGIETDGLGLTRAMERLRVGAGETVGLEVLRSDGARGVVLTADSLPALPAFEAERIEDGDRELLLVRLHQFTPGVGDALAEAVASSAGVDGIVLDLRGNPGGFVDALVAVAGTFLEPDSEIARLTGPEPVELRVPAEGAPTRLPVSVLVDAGTASAAEALAAALRSHGRARIYGERTFGKGLAHDATPVEEGAWVLMLPVGDLETPAGERILGLGVDPDVRSADPLARAIRDLRGRPGSGEASAAADRKPLVRPGDGTVLGSRIPEYASGWRVERVNPEGVSEEISVWADTVRVGDRDGRETLVRVQHIRPRQGPQRVLVNEVDRATLAPIRTTAERVGEEPFVDLRFEARRVTGRRLVTPANGGPGDQVPVQMTLELREPVFDWRLWGLLVAAMPLEEGYRARFLAYASEFPIGSPLVLVGVEVVGEESVETPSGPVLCHVVDVATGVPWTLWIRKEGPGAPVVQIRIRQADGNEHWWRPLGTANAGEER